MKLLSKLVLFTLLTKFVSGLEEFTFPALFFSYRLVPGLRASLAHSEQQPFSIYEATNIIERSIEQCLSDVYLIINLPGLAIEDFQNFQGFETLRKHMSQSSSLITFPNVITDSPEITFDVDKFEKMLKIHCNTKTHLVSDTDAQHELPRFIDTRKRLLRIDLSPLEDSFTAEERLLKLQEYDELFKELIRRLPSPNHSVILTSSTPRKYVDPQEKIYDVQDIPMDPRNLSPEIRRAVKTSKTMIFPDISIFDMTRYLDFERNKHNERAELVGDDQEIPNGQWAKDLEVNGGSNEHDDTWLSKKSKSIKKEKSLYRFGEDSNDFMRILDRQTLLDNSLTIAFGVLLLLLFVFIDVLKGLVSTLRKLSKFKAKAKKS